MEMTKKDREALELCITIVERNHAQRFEDVCAGIPNPRGGWFAPPKTWEEKAITACHWCQYDALNLYPWQSAPHSPRPDGGCWEDDRSKKLHDRMVAAGVSIYHPDPLRALEEAKRCALN